MKKAIFYILFYCLHNANVYGQQFSFTEKLACDTCTSEVRIKFYPVYSPKTETIDTVIIVTNGMYSFRHTIGRPGYLSVQYRINTKEYVNKLYLVLPGDRVQVRRRKGGAMYTGKGSERYHCTDSLETHSYLRAYTMGAGKISVEKMKKQEVALDSVMKIRERVIRHFNIRPLRVEQALLMNNLIARRQTVYTIFHQYWPIFDTATKRNMASFFDTFYRHKELEIEPALVSLTAGAGSCLFTKAMIEANIDTFRYKDDYTRQRPLFNRIFHRLAAEPEENIRACALAEALATVHLRSADSTAAIITLASRLIRIPPWKQALSRLLQNSSSGAPAFPFALDDIQGRKVTLNSFRGKTIIMDFWFTGCRACIEMTKKATPALDSLINTGRFAVISVSTDTNKDIWRKSVASELYGGSKNIHLFTGGKGTEHPLIQYYRIAGYPTLLIIDRYGNLFERNVPNPGTDSDLSRFMELAKKADLL